MGNRPPENWRMSRHMPRPMPPQHTPETAITNYVREMRMAIATQNRQNTEIYERFCANMAIATQNRQNTEIHEHFSANMAIATQNRQDAEIHERFCANMANESRQSNRHDSRPKYNNYVEPNFDPNKSYGTENDNQAPYEGGGNNQLGGRSNYNNDYVEPAFDSHDPYGTESNTQDHFQNNQAPYEGGGNNQSGGFRYNNQHAEPYFDPNDPYGTETDAQVPYQDNNKAPYGGGSNNQSRGRRRYFVEPAPEAGFESMNPYGPRQFNRRDNRPRYNSDYVDPPQEPGFESMNPYGPESNNQAPYQGNNQTLYEGGGNNQAPYQGNNQPLYEGGGNHQSRGRRRTYVEPPRQPGFESVNPYGPETNTQAPYQGNTQASYEGEGNDQAPHQNDQALYEVGGNNQYAEPGFGSYNPYGTETNNQVPFQGNQIPYEGEGNNQFSHGDRAEGSNNQTPYGGGGSSEAIAQAETSNQGKELFPRKRERDPQNSQARNNRSRSRPPQRERSLANRISLPPKAKIVLHTVVESPRLGAPFGGKYKMTEAEQEDIQLYSKEVFGKDRFANDNQCGNCGHFGHWLDDCAFPDDQGTIMGCPMCNTKLHFWDECQKKNSLTAEEQLELLLLRRRRKPMIRSSTSLRDLLTHALQEGMESLLNEKGLPWTQGYTMKLIKKRRDQPWLKFEPFETNDFPQDPETKGDVRDVMNSSIAENECHRPRAMIQPKNRRG